MFVSFPCNLQRVHVMRIWEWISSLESKTLSTSDCCWTHFSAWCDLLTSCVFIFILRVFMRLCEMVNQNRRSVAERARRPTGGPIVKTRCTHSLSVTAWIVLLFIPAVHEMKHAGLSGVTLLFPSSSVPRGASFGLWSYLMEVYPDERTHSFACDL